MACSLMSHQWKYNISANPVHTIERLYNKAATAVQLNDSMAECLTLR